MGSEDDLNPKQRRFVAEYILTLDPTKAAIAAGYSEKTAKSQGNRLLTHATVASEIERRQQALQIRTEITQDMVLRELAAISFSDVTNYVDNGTSLELAPNAPKNAMRAISSVKFKTYTDGEGNTTRETEFKLWNKNEALKIAGRHTGTKGFSDRVEVATATDTPVTIVIAGSMPTAKESVTVTAETTTTADALMTYNRTKE